MTKWMGRREDMTWLCFTSLRKADMDPEMYHRLLLKTRF